MAPPPWASEAKERMVEVAATEPQGPSEGSWHLGSLHEASKQWRRCAVGGTSVAVPTGLTGGRGEKIKVPVGPQTVAVVRPCPLPLPSLAPHPIWGGGDTVRAAGAPRALSVQCVLPFWCHRPLFSISLLVDCAAHRPRLSECLHLFPSASTWLALPWALCVTVDGAECSCGFNELLWVAPYLRRPLPSSHHQPLGRRGCVCLRLCLSLCPPCSHPPCIRPSAPGCALRAPFRSKLVEACIPAKGLDACLRARNGTGAWWQLEWGEKKKERQGALHAKPGESELPPGV